MAPTLNYLLDRTTSRQWRGFLAALAEEFQTQLGADELRQLMARIGQRFGAASIQRMIAELIREFEGQDTSTKSHARLHKINSCHRQSHLAAGSCTTLSRNLAWT